MEISSPENFITMNTVFILLSFLLQFKSIKEIDWNEENSKIKKLFWKMYKSVKKYNDMTKITKSSVECSSLNPFSDYKIHKSYMELKLKFLPMSRIDETRYRILGIFWDLTFQYSEKNMKDLPLRNYLKFCCS